MSFSSDLLAAATPTRLFCRGGRWVLELSRLEAVERNVFQPKVQRLEGPDAILALLRRTGEGQVLASAAAQLMRGGRLEEDRAFDAEGGEWVPAAEVPAWPALPGALSDPPERATGRILAEMQAELSVVRASHERLRERVAALEAHQHGMAPVGATGRLPRGSRSRRRSEPPRPEEIEALAQPLAAMAAALDATQASAEMRPPGRDADDDGALAAATPAGAAPQTFAELAHVLADAAVPTFRELKPPMAAAVVECIEALMTGAPPLTPQKKPIDVTRLKSVRGSKLLDDEGNERGVILADLRAATLLGAALMMIPSEEAERQITDSAPSEDVLLAMAEVCNNLSGPINKVDGNDHVHVAPFEELDVAALPPPRTRLDFEAAGGSLVFYLY